MPTVRLRFFAAPRDAVGAGSLPFDVPEGATVGDLLDRLYAARPELQPWRGHLLIGVNHEYAGNGVVLRDGDEVAFMPPVSGGAGDARLHPGPLDVNGALDALAREGAGATVCFLGTVRGEEGAVDRLEFEAYEPMAERTLRDVRARALEKFSLTDALIRHRTGTLSAGEDIVLVATAAPHRREAFEAAAWIMDELKATAPIWKREVGPGHARWVNDPVTGGDTA